MPKLAWRVKLVAELRPGGAAETELARIERGEEAGLAELGLRLEEAKRLTPALQTEIVTAQVIAAGGRDRCCTACGSMLAGKGHYRATFRSLFGAVPVRIRRSLARPCQGPGGPKSFAALDLGGGAAPELAYVTARHAALSPSGKVAALLSELLPIGGAANPGTVRNRTRRVGVEVVKLPPAAAAKRPEAGAAGVVVVGPDGGHVRSPHPGEGRHFEVVADKVLDAEGVQHRFAFARSGQAASAETRRQALAAAGVTADTPATVLRDGDAWLRRLQREVLPGATPVLDWWHVAVRFEHALQAARGLVAGTAGLRLAGGAVRRLERAKRRPWHGRRARCRRQLTDLRLWTRRRHVRGLAGVGRLRRHLGDLLGHLERNQAALAPYATRRRHGVPISTAFVESAINEIVARRMNKAQQMRWSRATVQPFLNLRTAMLNGTLEDAFRQRYPGFRAANDGAALPAAA